MTIVSLPLDPGAHAMSLLHEVPEQDHVIGSDAAGKPIVQLAVDDWALDQLVAFDAGGEDFEKTATWTR
jgi:hypothetical protein